MSHATNKYSVAAGNLSQRHALAGRPTVDTIENREGVIVAIDAQNMGIQCGDVQYMPVNLPEALQQAGIRVVFSGSVMQMDPAELWAAQPVMLTAIEKV